MASTLTPSTTTTDPLNVAESAALSTHKAATNPHSVTAAQVGAEPVNANIQSHISNTANPHATPVAFTPVKGVAAMRLLTPINNAKYWLEYHTTPGDGGHGSFRGVTGAAPATYVDNGGTIIVPAGGDGSAAFLREGVEGNSILDVRWFGCAVDGVTNDTAKVQGIIDSFPGGATFTVKGHMICGALTYPANTAYLWKVNGIIQTPAGESFVLPSYVGFFGEGGALSAQFNPNVKVARIIGSSTSDPVLLLSGGAAGRSVENVLVDPPVFTGILIDGKDVNTALFRLKNVNCKASANATSKPFVSDTAYWIDMDDCVFHQVTGGGPYSAEFRATGGGGGAYSGLVTARNLRVNKKGILIHNNDANTTAGFKFIDPQIENPDDGVSLFEFDIQNSVLSNVTLIRPRLFDNVGTGYMIKNLGGTVSPVRLEGVDFNDDIINPASAPIKALSVQGMRGFGYTSPLPKIEPAYIPYSRDYSMAIDAHNANARTEITTLPVTAEVCSQDLTTWSVFNGAVVTSGIRAPDGSTKAYQISGGGFLRNNMSTITPVVGDWIIVGCWVQSTVDGFSPSRPLFDLAGGGWKLNGSTITTFSPIAAFEPALVDGKPWVWVCAPAKITTAGTGTALLRLILKDESPTWAITNYYMPGVIHIPASLGIPDHDIIRMSKTLRSWPSGAKAGTTTMLDHQTFRTGINTTANRPSASAVGEGAQFYDKSLDKPIWSNGNIWKDATGAAV